MTRPPLRRLVGRTHDGFDFSVPSCPTDGSTGVYAVDSNSQINHEATFPPSTTNRAAEIQVVDAGASEDVRCVNDPTGIEACAGAPVADNARGPNAPNTAETRARNANFGP